MDNTLLDPRNDFVFKLLFANSLPLLSDLINAVRSFAPPIVAVSVQDPVIPAKDLHRKFIILDILAKDEAGHFYNIEIQMSRQQKWSARSTYYLAKTLAGQLKSGEKYGVLKPVIGIHLLGYKLFDAPDQALWCFEMRDRVNPLIRLGGELQLNIIELSKADRLIKAGKVLDQSAHVTTALAAWVLYFEHWKEENIMNQIAYPPVKEALKQLTALSADEKTRRLADMRERALMAERTEIDAAVARGEEIGEARGKTLGAMETKQEILRSLIQSGMSEAQARAILHM
jgi:predicted transposase/invertase (TIGR01784 family)